MKYTYEETVKAIKNDKGIVKDSFFGHNGYIILWFDHAGYSVTSSTRNSHGTSGILNWDNAKKEFFIRIQEIMNYD